jgi:serine/threonine protein kinase/Tol biopolymer transport system component
MGAVYLGQDADGRRVAVKVVRSELARDAAFVARFRDEVANAQRVASFCTAQVLDHGESGGRAYMVTEFIDGVSLLLYVKENGELSPGMLQGVAVGVAAALVAIHSAGLIHRDLKPANVLLSFSGPRVIDFGIARALDAASGHTMTGQLIGSPGWMAPEQILQQPVTTAVDIFSWGCLVAYARNGVNPFGRGDFSVLAARLVHGDPQVGTLPAPLDRLVHAALEKDPRNRPTARDLLLTMVGGESSEAEVLRTLAPAWRPPVPPPARGRTRPLTEPTQQQQPSPGPAAPYPAAASAPTPTAYGGALHGAEPLGPQATVAASPSAPPRTLPTVPSGPPPGGSHERPSTQGRRRAVLAGGVAAVLAAGAVTGWYVVSGNDKPSTARSAAAPVVPAALPSDPLLVRIDRQPGWPYKCYGNIGMLTPGAANPKLVLDLPGKCDILPRWSPDYKRIAFTRTMGALNELFVMNADGSGLKMITDQLPSQSRVAWSPDGMKIAMLRKVGSVRQLYVVSVKKPDSGTQLTTDHSNKDDVAWCGNRLAFLSDRYPIQQIFTTDATTKGASWAQVTKGSYDVNDPAWSPDCRKIAYTEQPSTDDRHIWVVGADGTGPKQITPADKRDMDPNWSRQGTWIAFARGATEHPRIWATRADGSGGAQLISPSGKDIGQPDWS